jgi:hypothetical protein
MSGFSRDSKNSRGPRENGKTFTRAATADSGDTVGDPSLQKGVKQVNLLRKNPAILAAAITGGVILLGTLISMAVFGRL